MAQQENGAVRRVAARRYWREADARVIVEAWQESGDSLAGFAQRYRVDRKRIARWASRLRATSPTPTVRFHPVHVVAGATDDRRGGAPIEVVFAEGPTVRVPPGCAAEDVTVVLRVVAAEAAC
jgi:hypothetical protein